MQKAQDGETNCTVKVNVIDLFHLILLQLLPEMAVYMGDSSLAGLGFFLSETTYRSNSTAYSKLYYYYSSSFVSFSEGKKKITWRSRNAYILEGES